MVPGELWAFQSWRCELTDAKVVRLWFRELLMEQRATASDAEAAELAQQWRQAIDAYVGLGLSSPSMRPH